MKTHNSPLKQLAILTADLTASDDGWYHLLPAGRFKARDGRPHDTADGYWHIDADIAATMIAATRATAPKILIDYDHQTLRTEQNGQPAPASAWLNSATDIEWREGRGLYIRPAWTANAQTLIDNKEYAFLSAVFPYDKNGRPLLLRMAAITNDPGLVGLDPVAALAAYAFPIPQTEDPVLNEALEKLLAKLGIVADGDLTDELATAALTALDTLQTKAAQADELQSQVAILSAQKDSAQKESQIDLAKYVPVETYNGVVGELAVLKAGSDASSIESLVKAAREEGKVIEAEVGYLTDFGKQQGVAALKAMLESRPAIAALSARQTSTTKPAVTEPEQLTDDVLAILKATGLSKEQYLAQTNKESE